jgi:4-hydroxy-tetrahydrodipicolinate synthase
MAFSRDSIKGSIPALITPMQGGKVDEAAFRKLVSWQIAQGSHGLVPCGTTGESPTLSHDEHMRVIEICVEEANGRVPVIAGAGSNATAEAISLTRHAKKVGADAVLSVTGYYNKPSQEGLYRHYAAIADAVDIPIVVYNIPARAIVEISVETMGRLSKIANIIGVKDATANLMRPTRERAACGKEWRPSYAPSSRPPACKVPSSTRCSSRTSSCRCTTRCSANPAPPR